MAQGELSGVRVAPNPAAGRAWVEFTLARPGPVRVAVFDVLGREVGRLVDGIAAAGAHRVACEGARHAGRVRAGIYHVRVESGARRETRRVVVLN